VRFRLYESNDWASDVKCVVTWNLALNDYEVSEYEVIAWQVGSTFAELMELPDGTKVHGRCDNGHIVSAERVELQGGRIIAPAHSGEGGAWLPGYDPCTCSKCGYGSAPAPYDGTFVCALCV
jgi:hypothetical protein